MLEFLIEATQQVKQRMPSVIVCSYGHAGDGSIDFNFTQPLEMDSQKFNGLQAEFNKIVHDIVHRMNGSIAAEHGGGQLKSQELKHYMNPVEYQMMKMIKRRFDPENLFNPHKVINMGD